MTCEESNIRRSDDYYRNTIASKIDFCMVTCVDLAKYSLLYLGKKLYFIAFVDSHY